MPNITSAKKRTRQAERRRIHNMNLRSRMRTSIKKVVAAIDNGDKEAANTAYKQAVPIVDSTANKGIIHKNKAARHKSRLNSRIQAL